MFKSGCIIIITLSVLVSKASIKESIVAQLNV